MQTDLSVLCTLFALSLKSLIIRNQSIGFGCRCTCMLKIVNFLINSTPIPHYDYYLLLSPKEAVHIYYFYAKFHRSRSIGFNFFFLIRL